MDTFQVSSFIEVRKAKIEQLVRSFFDQVEEGSLSDKEIVLTLANVLYFFGKEKIRIDNINLNTDNALDVEHQYLKDPNNLGLGSLMQSHIFIKWSEGIR
jgi:hypothetical protein